VVMTKSDGGPHMRFPSHKEDCRCRIQQTAASSEGGVDIAEGWRGCGRGRGWAGDEELRRRLAWARVRSRSAGLAITDLPC
jgi:hypothetical protein